MDDPFPQVRVHTAFLLGVSILPEAQEALVQHLRTDPVEQVRKSCAMGLADTPQTSQKVEGYFSALQDPCAEVAERACIELGKIADPQAIEPLRAALEHPSWKVRFRACQTLVRLQAVDLRLLRLLEELHQQPEAEENNRMVREFDELAAKHNPQALNNEWRWCSTQDLIDRAWRALQ